MDFAPINATRAAEAEQRHEGPSLTFAVERSTDYELTDRLLARSFPRGYERDGAYLRWLYTRAGTREALVVAARRDGAKIGQMVFIPHEVAFAQRRALLGFTVDFFVLPEHRSGPLTIKLTRAAQRHSRELGFDGLYGIPNAVSMPVSTRFMNGTQTTRLAVRWGLRLRLPVRPSCIRWSADAGTLDDATLARELAPFLADAGMDRRFWTPEALVRRMRSPVTSFALHANDEALAISCRHTIRHLDFTMLCGFFPRGRRTVSDASIHALVSAACAHHHRPNFAYVGTNADLESLPGAAIPERFRPSPLTILASTFKEDLPIFAPNRYELIDCDIV